MLVPTIGVPIFGFTPFVCKKKTAPKFNGIFAQLRFLQEVVKPEVAKIGQNVFRFTPLIDSLP